MNKKFNTVLKIAKRSIRVRTLIFFILILVFNTCAWFIYISEVSSDITTHVKSWKIEFDNDISQELDFDVENIYPGMETEYQELTLTNTGEVEAIVSCEILEMRILDETYIVDDINITSEDLIESISDDYPFKIKFYINDIEQDSVHLTTSQAAIIKIEISWAFESGNDAADTYWGNSAYDFMEDNPDASCIQIRAKIKASQAPNTP